MTTSVKSKTPVCDPIGLIETNNDLLALPDAVVQILEMVQNDEVSIESLAETISRDPALTGRLLKIATSPHYGLNIRSGNIQSAVMALGINSVKCLALSAAIFDPSKYPKIEQIDFRDIYGNILAIATTARKLADICHYKYPEEAFLSGLLSKIGFLFFLQHFPEEYVRVINEVKAGKGWLEAEKEVLNISHPQAGAMITRKWRLNDPLINAIENHMSIGLRESEKLDDIIRMSVALNIDCGFGSESQFEEKIVRIEVISERLGLSSEELDQIISSSVKDTLLFAKSINLDIGSPEDILIKANREIFKTYLSIQKLFKERQELTRNILDEERERGISEAKQIAISTLSHYINNSSMIIYGQSQVLRMMLKNDKKPEELCDALGKSLDTVDESVRKMVAVLEELSELNMLDDVEYFDQSKIINIDDRIKERMSKLQELAEYRPRL